MSVADTTGGASRRTFLKAGAAGAALAAGWTAPGAYAAGTDTIRVGVIGCGGRGSGAAENCLDSSPGVKVVALGDAFPDRMTKLRSRLLKEHPEKVDLPEDRCFVGLDAYEKVIAAGVDLVILATPPGFRPLHIEAAVAAGKHVFCEKPVAVDGPGIRRCLAAYETAKQKGLGIVAGTQRRHQTGYLETIKRLHDGAIGEIVSGRCYWNQGPIWVRKRDDKMTDLEWQLRNWYYFVWLCGDHIVEQHVHNLDVINWVTKAHPVKCVGVGGRQVRTGPEFGHIFDHFCIDFEYPGGVHVTSMCRQFAGTKTNVSEAVVGTKGTCQVNAYDIRGGEGWRFSGKDNAPYVQEHTDLIAGIRAGKPLNELKQVAESTLTAIMGRMAAYTGQEVTWDAALNSKENTMPSSLDWKMSLPVPPVALPGKTPLL
jgi:predicted dehydrogenase